MFARMPDKQVAMLAASNVLPAKTASWNEESMPAFRMLRMEGPMTPSYGCWNMF